MNPAGRVPKRNHIARVQRLARERADAQARRIPWQRLLHNRNEYIDWQEFYLWVRSVLEIENRIPHWLIQILNECCPGFVENEKKLMSKAAKNRLLPLRLEDWIDDQVFGFAKEGGWFSAVTFYAIREPRYQRAEVCWSECVERFKKARRLRYPTFEEWKLMAEQCDPTARLLPELRKRLACMRKRLIRRASLKRSHVTSTGRPLRVVPGRHSKGYLYCPRPFCENFRIDALHS